MTDLPQTTMHEGTGAENLPLPVSALQNESRQVIACPSCRLNQFMTAGGNCRRCHKPFKAAEPPEETFPAIDRRELPVCGADANLAQAFSCALYIVRLGLCLSQLELADRIGAARTYISKLENEVTPTVGQTMKILTALDISPLAFFQLVEKLMRLPACESFAKPGRNAIGIKKQFQATRRSI
jgi:DNA-binding XRE family transcriptional regulator